MSWWVGADGLTVIECGDVAILQRQLKDKLWFLPQEKTHSKIQAHKLFSSPLSTLTEKP